MAKKQKPIYEEFGIEGVVFILAILIGHLALKLQPIYSVLIGLVAMGITYLIKNNLNKK